MKSFVRLIAAVFLTGWIGAAYAQTAANRASLETQNNTFVYTNGQGAITAATLNPLLGNYAASMATLLDANVFLSTQTYLMPPIFAGLTGYCYANGNSPITCSTSINGASIAGTNTLALSLLQQIPQRSVLGNQFGALGNVSTPWTVPNSTDTIIPLVHGTVAEGDYACYSDSLGTLKDCGPVGDNFAATAPISVSFPSRIPTFALNYDANFIVSEDNLALAPIAPGALLGNSLGSTAEPAAVQTGTGVLAALGSPLNSSGGVLGTALASGDLFIGNSSGIAAGVPMSGDATISNSGALTLASSGVTAGTYGDGTHVAQVTVDAMGRATAAASVAINIPSSAVSGLGNLATQNAGTGLANSGSALNLQPGTNSAIGGVEAIATISHEFITSIVSGVPVLAQPSFADISGSLNLATQATGTLGVANGGTGRTTVASNFILIGNGTGPLQVGLCSDTGAQFVCGENLGLSSFALLSTFTADATISAGQLVKINNLGEVVPTATTDVDGVLGISHGAALASQQPPIAISGQQACIFDGPTTAGDWVTISATVAGDCHDTGSATRATGQQQIGQVLSTNASAGTYAINIENQYTPAGGSGSGNVTGPASAVAGDLPSFSDTTGKVLGDSGVPAASVVQTLNCPHDGVTDASTCINAALTAATPGTILQLAPGSTYIHSTLILPPLKSNVRFTGSGTGASTITTDQVITMLQIGTYNYTGSDDWNYATDASYYDEVDNLQLKNTSAAPSGSIGIDLRGMESGTVKGITCNNITDCIRVNPINGFNHIEQINSVSFVTGGLQDVILVNGVGFNSNYNSTGNQYIDIIGQNVSRSIITFTGCTFGDFTVSNVNGYGIPSGGDGSAGGAIAAIYLDQTGKCGDGSTSYGSRWAISNVKMDGVSDYVVKGIGVDHGSVSNLADGGNVTDVLSFDSTSANMAFGQITTKYNISALPACSPGTRGLQVTIGNGASSPSFNSTVSATGSVIGPVYCNGVNWVYR